MKFAYLIMAHKNPEQLKLLLKLLDYEENRIYLHIDRKSPMAKDPDQFRIVKYAKLFVFAKYKVAWGSFEQTRAQMFLLEEAVKDGSDYYHLISGQDLPLKTQKELQTFLEKHRGKEFIHFEQREPMKAAYMPFYNTSCYAKNRRIRYLYKVLDNKLVSWQQKRGVHRELYKGANWFSITHELAKAVAAEKKKVLRQVKNWHNSDEYVLQTFFIKQYDIEKKYGGYECDNKDCLRYIDWKRGNPYVWRLEQYEELMSSPYFFARKFDEQIDSAIIEKIYNQLKRK